MSGPLLSGEDEVTVGRAAIDPAALVGAVADRAAGAVVLFLGTVRDHSPGRPGVTGLDYEAYEELVVAKIAAVVADARQRHAVRRVRVAHRIGPVAVGEASVGVAVSAGHRPEAFAAARFIIDELKATAPIWKKETWSGGEEWVAGS